MIGPRGSSETKHLFTVDMEEYFQVHVFDDYVDRAEWEALPSRVELSTKKLLDILERHDVRGTFFVLGWIAERHPNLVSEISDAGHEVASHGWGHRRITDLSREEFREEARRSKAKLEEVTGRPVYGYRAPSFSLVPGVEWALEILVEEGYRYDSSIFPIRRLGYGYPGACPVPHFVNGASGSLLELPPATFESAGLNLPAAGGAYFRHLPYALTRSGFQQMEERGASGVFYVHSWEVDEYQPRLPVSWLRKIRHYRGLDRMPARLDRLFRDFEFTSVARRFGLEGEDPDAESATENYPVVRDDITSWALPG